MYFAGNVTNDLGENITILVDFYLNESLRISVQAIDGVFSGAYQALHSQGGDSDCRGNPKGSLDDAYVLFYSMDDVFVENCPTDVYTGNNSADNEHGYVCFSDFTEEWEEDTYQFKIYDSSDNMLQGGHFYYVPLPCDEGDDCVEWFDEDATTLATGDTDADGRQNAISFGYDAQTDCGCTVDIRVILSITGTEGGSYGNIYIYQSIYSDSRSDDYEGSWQAEEHDTYTFHFKLYDNATSDMEDDFIYSNIELYGPNQAPELDELDTPSESTTQYEGEELQFSFSATDPDRRANVKHIVTIEDLNNKDIIDILDRAKKLVPIAEGKKTSKSLSGKIVATCFFEPSTRTRLSFETAILRLGGNYIGFADPSATSHIKGETLADSIRMVSAVKLKF